MGGKSKGDRHERYAREILEDSGWVVETPNYTRYQNTDFFNLFDLMAFKEGEKPLFVQVRTNRPKGISSFNEKCKEKQFPFDFANAEFWTRYDSAGWRADKVHREGYETKCDERDKDTKIGETMREKYSNDPSSE